MIAAFLNGDHLAPRLLAIPVGDFKRLADRSSNDGRAVYSMGFPPHPKRRRSSRWSDHLVTPGELPRLFAETFEPRLATPPFDPGRQGLLGELDLLNRLAENESLDLYRPFPDLEDIDIGVRHVATHRIRALQVKTLGYDERHPAGSVGIHAESFRPLPDLDFVIYGGNRTSERFAETALIIPAADILGLARLAEGKLKLDWQPEGPQKTRWGRYALPTVEVAAAIEALLL